MNKEEITKALEIIREPITVNCKEYHYFDDENYSKLINVYENCLWFINNFEQINETAEELIKENEKLHHYKTLYQSLKRQKEELRDWLKEDKDKIKVYDTKNNNAVELGIIIGLGMCVEKIEELEGVSNE